MIIELKNSNLTINVHDLEQLKDNESMACHKMIANLLYARSIEQARVFKSNNKLVSLTIADNP